ncbi:MAG: M1 family metallopeptidase [Lewinellaceae bacterium]|nr:M1 family metallopeptidase [Lewinellaceae bacterium]
MANYLFFAFTFMAFTAQAQPDRWQQRVSYQMDVDFDVNAHQFQGKQSLVYTNNSPDTLNRVFYHLYFNAFQPGSAMDVRSRTISDPDPRVGARIAALSPQEIGYQKILSLQHNGKPVTYEVVGTILEVQLTEPILPNSQATFAMEFQGQVPLQIRRSGRNNAEGIDYSMAQWYPKMCEYDYQGWHANPYIGREFYGVWGDYDVTIHIDKAFTVAATGYLQNAEEIGKGYLPAGKTPKPVTGNKLHWHFVAPDVHDFLWAADPDYKHTSLTRKDGLVLNFFYQENERTKENWEALPKIMDQAFDYINANFGQYQYKQYSFIQGGDGGMEYPMATLITGERSLGSLVGVAVHELMHSWYQMMLGTNESLYAWMDEGFTSYASSRVMSYLGEIEAFPGARKQANPQLGSYAGYLRLARTDMEEPLSIHSDHFVTNRAYSTAAYSKGAVFMNQLEYIVGKQVFDRALLRYFNTWKLKHPNANDLIRIFEKESGLELDWYREYFVNTTHTIDYGVTSVSAATNGGGTEIQLAKVGVMPMPVDVVITLTDGSSIVYTIPLEMMRGAKSAEGAQSTFRVAPDWSWVNPAYTLVIPESFGSIATVTIDPTQRLADVNTSNNQWTKP